MIPQFPANKLLEVTDKKDLSKILLQYDAYSDFNFVSLWSYNTAEDLQISQLFGNLVVRFKDYLSDRYFYSFIGNNETIKTTAILLKKASVEDIEQVLKLIPEQNLKTNEKIPSIFKVIEDRNNFDYILSLKEIAALEGPQYRHQRKEITRFFRNYPNAKIKQINLQEKSIQQQILNLFSTWAKLKEKTDTAAEIIAIKRTMNYSDILDIFALALYIGNEMIGFSITDIASNEYVEAHFLKYHPSYTGVKHLLHNYLAKTLLPKGFTYINLEQDLGIHGLRDAKLACKPIKYLKKYTISNNK